MAKYGRQLPWFLSILKFKFPYSNIKKFLIQEDQCIKRYFLGVGGNMFFDSKEFKKTINLGISHIDWVFAPMEANKISNPVAIRFLSLVGQIPGAHKKA